VHSVEVIVSGRWRQNCYLVHDGKGNAIVIDPGGESRRIRDHVARAALTVKAVLNTHFDHVGAVAEIAETYAVPFCLHSADLELLNHANLYRTLFDGSSPVRIPRVDVDLSGVQALAFDKLSVEVITVPGHTPGGVCFRIGDDLFTGDLIIGGRAGRTDLPGGDRKSLRGSLRRLFELSPTLRMHPGHGRSSILGEILDASTDMAELVR
jgi:hydroxyacylglutathione hydrolase